MVYGKSNDIMVNPGKFQAMILQNSRNSWNYKNLEIGSANMETKNKVKLLGITIDNKLNNEKHLSELYKKVSIQLNATRDASSPAYKSTSFYCQY